MSYQNYNGQIKQDEVSDLQHFDKIVDCHSDCQSLTKNKNFNDIIYEYYRLRPTVIKIVTSPKLDLIRNYWAIQS